MLVFLATLVLMISFLRNTDAYSSEWEIKLFLVTIILNLFLDAYLIFYAFR